MSTRHWRILLAEDNLADAILIEESIKRRSISCVMEHYSTAPEAMEAIRQAGAGNRPIPDLILLDFNLPGGHGLAILNSALENPHLKNVPKAILSSFLRPHELTEVAGLGASVVLKPADLHEFFSKIGHCIEELLHARARSGAAFPGTSD